jgi:hypothetical protein
MPTTRGDPSDTNASTSKPRAGREPPPDSRIYFPDEEEANAADPVLSSIEVPEFRSTLVAREEGGGLRFDTHLQGESQTAFFEL